MYFDVFCGDVVVFLRTTAGRPYVMGVFALLVFGFYVFEVADGLVYAGHKGECVGVLGKDTLEVCHLVLVDDAHKHLQIGVRVHSACVDLRNGVVKVVDDILGDFVGILCDDFHLDSALVRFEHGVADSYGHKTVQNAQNYWVHGKVVHKVAGNCHGNVHDKN